MPLIALGLNHLTAPFSLREQVAFDPAATTGALRELMHQPGVNEAVILSTCNRTELYAQVAEGAERVPEDWLGQHSHLTPGELNGFLYHHDEDDAVRHMFRVSTGLDSMILGETQILGQVKHAYHTARQAQALKASMHRLMQHTFAVAKRVRTDTGIGAHTVSLASTAIRLAGQVFTDLEKACVLLLGAGDNIELTASHLTERKVRRLIVANRRLEHAQQLAQRYGGYAMALTALPQHLAEADIVIASTASRQPIVNRAMVEQAIVTRRRKPMFLVDMAMPHDIEPDVGELEDVFLYSIDDLNQVIDDNHHSRKLAARAAEAIINLHVKRYMTWRQASTLKNPALALRDQANLSRDASLLKARAMIERGKSAEEALVFLANTLTNKLLHRPSKCLHEATINGDLNLLYAAERLYSVDYKTSPADEPVAKG